MIAWTGRAAIRTWTLQDSTTGARWTSPQLVIARALRRRFDPRTLFIRRASADAPFANALGAFIERTGRTGLLGDEQVRSDRMVIARSTTRLSSAMWSSSCRAAATP